MPREVAPYYHLYPEWDAFPADRHVRCGNFRQPIRANVIGSFQHVSSYLIQYLSFKWYWAGKYYVKCRDPVRGDHYQPSIGDGVNIPDLASIESCLMRKLQCFHGCKFTSPPREMTAVAKKI